MGTEVRGMGEIFHDHGGISRDGTGYLLAYLPLVSVALTYQMKIVDCRRLTQYSILSTPLAF